MSAQLWRQFLELREVTLSGNRSLTRLHAGHFRSKKGSRSVTISSCLKYSSSVSNPTKQAPLTGLSIGTRNSISQTVRHGSSLAASDGEIRDRKKESQLQLDSTRSSEKTGRRELRANAQNVTSRRKPPRDNTTERPPRRRPSSSPSSRHSLLPGRADIQNAIASLRLTDSSSAESGLPLSPLMDPKLRAARSRWTQSKPPPSEELTTFQRACNANPFARMLASPVRTCAVTDVRLPSELLTPYIICTDPDTGIPWQLPSQLQPSPSEQALLDENAEQETLGGSISKPSSSYPSSTKEEEMPDQRAIRHTNNSSSSDKAVSHLSLDKDATASKRLDIGDERTKDLEKFFSRCWISTNQRVLKHMASERLSKRRRAFASLRWYAGLDPATLSAMRARDDNAEFVLARMQHKAKLSLALAARHGARHGLVSPWPLADTHDVGVMLERSARQPSTAREVDEEVQGAVVLWLGADDKKRLQSEDAETLDSVKLQDIARQLDGDKETERNLTVEGPNGVSMPLFSGEKILGKENLDWLRDIAPVFQHQCVLLKMRTGFRNAPTWLWRLHLLTQQ